MEVFMRSHPRTAAFAFFALMGATAAITLLLAAPAARASYDSKPEPPARPDRSGGSPQADENGQTPRQQADAWYRDAWKDVEKGTSELADGKAENAQKKFRRALERSRKATELDSTYYQAWNLVGFTSRKLGDYPGAFAAYKVALRLNPNYAQAREYYGEGLLETGDLAGARQQLAALERIGDVGMISDLKSAIAKYEAAHPGTSAVPAAADSAGTGSR
jgi:tetratricopeptide (TPR) repeat protein